MANLALWIPRLFLISAFIASLTCFARPDYNLPLFIFAYMAWGLARSQKSRIAWTLVFTLIIDLIWILYWGPFWGSAIFETGYWENGIHGFVVTLSVINLLLKIVIIGLIHRQENEVKQALTVTGLTEGLKSFFLPH